MNPNEQLLIKENEQVLSKDPNGAWVAVRTVVGLPVMRVKAGAQISEQPLTEDQAKAMAAASSSLAGGVAGPVVTGQAMPRMNAITKAEMAAGAVTSVIAAASMANGALSSAETMAKGVLGKFFKKK